MTNGSRTCRLLTGSMTPWNKREIEIPSLSATRANVLTCGRRSPRSAMERNEMLISARSDSSCWVNERAVRNTRIRRPSCAAKSLSNIIEPGAVACSPNESLESNMSTESRGVRDGTNQRSDVKSSSAYEPFHSDDDQGGGPSSSAYEPFH